MISAKIMWQKVVDSFQLLFCLLSFWPDVTIQRGELGSFHIHCCSNTTGVLLLSVSIGFFFVVGFTNTKHNTNITNSRRSVLRVRQHLSAYSL